MKPKKSNIELEIRFLFNKNIGNRIMDHYGNIIFDVSDQLSFNDNIMCGFMSIEVYESLYE